MEIITGVELRRRWRTEDKLRVLAEAAQPGERTSEMARRHDISRGTLWYWQRQLRQERLAVARTEVDAVGRPKTADLILERWEPMEILFDRDGRAQLPTIVVAPSQKGAVEAEVACMAANLDLRQRAEELIAR